MTYDDKIMTKVVAIQKLIDGSVTMNDVTEKLRCSIRTVYRYVATYKKHGPPGLKHGLEGRKSNNRNDKWGVLQKYAEKNCYRGFGPTLLSEKLEEALGYRVPVESLRRRMIERGIRVPRKPLKIKRVPRKRKDGYGMMIQFDGSYHDRLEDGRERCLLLGVDDATGDIMHVKFTKSEAIKDVIEYWSEYFKKYGKPSSIYLDRHSSYKVNHRKDQFDHTTKTRFQRAMNYLGVHVIFAKSPEGKGRVENKFRLFQDRGIKELRLKRIKDYKDAEKHLIDNLVPQWNSRYSKQASIEGNFHVPITKDNKEQLERHFALRTERKINKVGVVSYMGNKYAVRKGQTLNGRLEVTVFESHLGNIQIHNGENNLLFDKLTY